MEKVSKKGKTKRRLYALAAVFALVVSLFSGIPARRVAEAAEVWEDTGLVVNGDFESEGEGIPDWTVTMDPRNDNQNYKIDTGETNTTHFFEWWNQTDDSVDIELKQTIQLSPGTYRFQFDEMVDDWGSANVKVYGDKDNTNHWMYIDGHNGDGWDKWKTFQLDSFTITENTSVTFYLKSQTGGATAWWSGGIDNVKLLKLGHAYTVETDKDSYQIGSGAATITVDCAKSNIKSVKIEDYDLVNNDKCVLNENTEHTSTAIVLNEDYMADLLGDNTTVTKTVSISFNDDAKAISCDITLTSKPVYTVDVTTSSYTKNDDSSDAISMTVSCAADNIETIVVGESEATFTKEASGEDTVVTFDKDYLNSLNAGNYSAVISFEDGADDVEGAFTVAAPVHTVTVGVNRFAKNDANSDAISMTVDCSASKIASVSVGDNSLTKNTDYTITEAADGKSTTIGFNKTYLSNLSTGEYTATIVFNDDAESKTGEFTISVLPVGLQNGDFESTGADYIWNGGFGTQSKQNNNSGTYLNLWTDNKTSETILSQTFIAEKTGTFDISYIVIGDGDSGIDIYVNGTSIGSIVGDSYSWPEVTTTKPFKLTQGEVVKIEIKGIYSGTWAAIDDITIVEHSDEAEIPVGLQNGDFEASKYWEKNNRTEEGKTAEPFKIIKDDKGGTNETTYLNIWTEDTTKEYSISQTFKAEESGQYVINYNYLGSEGACGFDIYVNDTKVETLSGKGWTGDGVWTEKTTKTVFELKKDAVVTFAIKGKAASSSAYMKLDDIKIIPYEVDENARVFDIDKTIATGDKVDTDLYVEKLDLAKGFITGADISSYASIVASGATYKNAKGEPLSDAEFFELLAESGVNYVRIRVWVDPTDGNGNGYGGGNCDLATAKKLGKLATDAGMKVLIDFHYSDFWTDPGKQTTPKAWQGLTLDEKAQTLKEWTTKSLTEIINADVNVGMVQIGNETTTGFCGETNMTNMCKLFAAGSEGVRAVEEAKYDGKPTIMMAIHLTNPDKIDFSDFAAKLKENNVVYDVFATSFYPYWHGTLDNLYTKLAAVADEYDKYVMVAETSYVRTLEDGDGWENTETQSKKDNGDVFPYDISEQGQVLHIRNVINTLTSIPDNKGIGVFWWEPAWIPVQNWADAEDQDKVLAENKALWEEYGSGWATSAASDYDKNVGQWYGGSAVDNESWFDFDGKALESLKVYNMVRFGTNSEDYLIDVIDTEYSFVEGQEYSFPTEVDALYASGETYKVGVTWDQDQIEAAAASGYGSYEIDGIVTYNEEEYDVICKLTIKPVNLLVNGSFEDGKGEGWDFDLTHTTAGTNEKADGVKEEDSHDGKYTFHFYSTTDQSFTVTQKVTLEPGAYAFNGYFQGLAGVEGEIFVQVGDDEYAALYVLNGWVDWQNPEVDRIFITEETEVTVGFTCSYSAGAWGTCDDFTLYRMGDIVTISFDSNGHGVAPDDLLILEGDEILNEFEAPEVDEEDEVEFTGWYTDKDCTQKFEIEKPIYEDVTLYAGWKDISEEEQDDEEETKSYYLEGSEDALTWTEGDSDLKATYHSTVDDADTINHFVGVEIAAAGADGVESFAKIGGGSIRAESGSLKLTILSSYLETLEPGEYVLRVVFDDGTVDTPLTINAKDSDAEDETADEKESDSDVEPSDDKAADADVEPAEDSASKDAAPKTADETPIEATMLILLISAAGLSYILGLKRKRS
ncbi:MAG: glycosyl hydrolase 53 family protein [Eubacterium sp.]|nr:glycosyl hydrolase 53 family protein [Eubacterium sp.]